MALQQDTVSIDLAKGVNQKVDDKIAGPEQSSTLIDARFDKESRLTKRNGLTAQGDSFQGDPGFLNPVVINSATHKSKVFTHEDQLCRISNGNLLSQFKGQDKWVFKGTCVPVEIDVNRLNANVNFTDTVTVGSITIASGGTNVYVVEESTGNIIAANTIAEQAVRLIGFSNSAWVVTATGSQLAARQVSLVTGSISNKVVLANDYFGRQYPPNLDVTSSASAMGETAFIVYADSSLRARVVPFQSVGSISMASTLTLGSLSGTATAITIEPSVNPNRFYVADPSHVRSVNFGSTTYTYSYQTSYSAAASSGSFVTQVHAITLALSPVNNQDLFLFTDYIDNQNLVLGSSSFYSDDNSLTMIQLGSGGAILSNNIYGVGYSLFGQAFRDNARKTVYVPCVYLSPLQTTLFYMDALEGKTDKTTYVMGKTLYGQATSFSQSSAAGTSALSQVLPLSTDSDTFRLVNNGYLVDYNLTPDNSPNAQFFQNTTHSTGGLLWAYDGKSLSEHNFLIYPEQLQGYAAGNPSIGVSVTTVGGSTTNEAFVLTFPPASLISPGSAGVNYITWTAASTVIYYAYFVIDGAGGDPSIGGATPIRVDLSLNNTAQEVAYQFSVAVNAASNPYIASYLFPGLQPNQIRMREGSAGNVTAPSVNGMNFGTSLTDGSRQFCTIYSWVDRNGYNYRSTPSVPFTVTNTGSTTIGLTLWTPQVTNKLINEMNLEVYATAGNGTIFYLAGSSTMSVGVSRVSFNYSLLDSQLQTRPQLYTTGGILENYNIGAVKNIGFFKERLTPAGVDDGQAVYYSKAVVQGEPVNFAAELFFRVDADSGAVTATAQMDDKLIVHKPDIVYAMSGDGANDLGEGSTLSPPLLVASDVGTRQPNSVVLYPNGLLFKSSKGIYNLDRSLGVNYVGAPVEDYNSQLVSGAVLMKNQTEVRFTLSSASAGLIYNYFFNRWDFFSNHQAESCSTWNSKFVLSRANGTVNVENDLNYDVNNGSLSYSMSLEMPWLKLKGIQDFQRIYQLEVLGQYLSPHTLTINVAYDYDLSSSSQSVYVFDATQIIANAPVTPGSSVYQFQINLERQKCESIKIGFIENPDTTSSAQSSLYLNNLSAVVGLKKGLNKLPPDKQA